MLLRPTNLNHGAHVMLLYDNDQARDERATRYINEGIGKGQLVIYASVDAEDPMHLAKLALEVTEYGKNTGQGNLLIVSLKQCYENALAGNLGPFEDIKGLIEQSVGKRLAEGRNEETVVVADCADKLSKNEKFEECGNVEKWWNDTCDKWVENDLKITVICPHLRPMLDYNEQRWIATNHNTTVQVP
jgi:hypothetical protein